MTFHQGIHSVYQVKLQFFRVIQSISGKFSKTLTIETLVCEIINIHKSLRNFSKSIKKL